VAIGEHYTLQLRPIGQLWPVKKKALGGQRNPLKRLKMDKGIQGNQSLFLDFDPACPDLVGFG
jgi:hypothetical protein